MTTGEEVYRKLAAVKGKNESFAKLLERLVEGMDPFERLKRLRGCGNYIRYIREKEKVSFDLLVNSVLDRESEVVFGAELFGKYSRKRLTVGRANPIRIEMRIADPELLFVMKFVSARKQDIRNIFMLAGEDLKWDLIVKIISDKCSSDMVKKRIDLIKRSTEPKGYRDSIHGPFGKMPDGRFDLCKNRLLDFLVKL